MEKKLELKERIEEKTRRKDDFLTQRSTKKRSTFFDKSKTSISIKEFKVKTV
jgi:hypothetical protein